MKRAGSQLVHNAIRMIDGCSAIRREPLPLECGAERANFLLLILLLFSKFHENLTPKQIGIQKNYSNSNLIFDLLQHYAFLPTCSNVDWEKLYSS